MKQSKNNLNNLMPLLIKNSKDLSSEIKERIKSNNIFSELEARATKKFKFFIDQSEKRYLGSKFGSKMEYLLKNSKKKSRAEAKKIISDKFFLDQDIFNERKKMVKKTTNHIHESINEIIHNLKGINYKNYLKYNDSKEKKNTIYLRKYNSNKKFFDKNKVFLNNIITNEEKDFQNSFDKYKKTITEISENKNIKKFDRNKIEFDLPKINLLNYKASKPIKKTAIEEDKENKINMKKIMAYSYSGKNLYKDDNINIIKITDKNNVFSNTNEVVLKNAMNELKSVDKYKNKEILFENYFELDKIPNLRTYDFIIRSNFNKLKRERIKRNELLYKNQKMERVDLKERLNEKIEENIEFLKNLEKNFTSQFKTIE